MGSEQGRVENIIIIIMTSSRRHWQSNTEAVSGPVLTGSRVAPGAVLAASQAALGEQEGTVGSLSLDGCWALTSAGGCSSLQGGGPVSPSSSPGPGALGPCGMCPGATGRVVVVPSPCGLWLFLFVLGSFFAFAGSKPTPPSALEKARLCPGGCCPASPTAQG